MFNYTASDNQCTISMIIWLSIALIVDLFFVISGFVFICKFIRSFTKETKVISKSLFYAGIVFFVVSFVTLLLSVPFNFKCNHKAMFDTIDIAIKGFYSFHNYLLILLWSLRLSHAFNATEFKLSNPTLIFFAVNAFMGPIGLCYMSFNIRQNFPRSP